MKKYIVLLALSLFAKAAFAVGGSIAGNGGGLAEKNIVFAFDKLGDFIALSLVNAKIQLSQQERTLLAEIQSSLPQEKNNGQILNFYDGEDAPTFFKINNVVRVAKTGDHVEDTIYLNPQLLYSKDAQGNDQAIGIPMAASILIHELGHHHGIKDHAALDVLGTKVQLALMDNMERSEFWNGQSAVITVQLNSVHSDKEKKNLTKFDQLLLENNKNLYSLSSVLAKNIHCPQGAQSPVGLRIYNPHGERGVTFDQKTKLLTKPFRAWYILSCKQGEEADHGDLAIVLSFKKHADGSFQFLENKTLLQQISCKQSPAVCL